MGIAVMDGDAGRELTITDLSEYEFRSNFLQPTSAFSFTIGDDAMSDELRGALKLGAPVQLATGGRVQCTGCIDTIESTASREGGCQWHINGRDAFAQVVDGHCDPRA